MEAFFLKVFLSPTSKSFNSYMLTEILLESNYNERMKLQDVYFIRNIEVLNE